MGGEDKPPFGENQLKISAFTFAGLAMMLNIRLVYSASPYALLRFKLPENLFSVFVRVMAGSLELWCLPSMTIANIMDFARKAEKKEWYDWDYHWQSIFWSWCNFLTFVILWISFIIGGDQGNVTAFYWVIAASGFVFGINMVMVYAIEYQYLPWYMIGENSFPMVTSLMHYTGTLLFGNRRKWNSDYIVVTIDIIISLAISLVAAILWTCCYYSGEDAKDGFGASDPNQRACKKLSVSTTATELTYSIETNWTDSHGTKCKYKKSHTYYLHFIPPSLMVLIGMGLVYTIYPAIAPGMIVPFYLIDKIEMVLLIATAFPPVIIGIMKQYNINPYIPMGNWGTYHQKVCKGGSNPVPDKGTTEKCECGSGGSSTNPTLRVHNTTIKAGIGGLKAIATINVTKSGGDYNGSITGITQGTLRKDGVSDLKIDTPLQAGDILNLCGTGQGASSVDEVKIEGTIILTNPGTLGQSITLKGLLDGTLTLNDDTGNINVTIGAAAGLTANPNLQGITVTIGTVTGTATMEITTTKQDDDLTTITGQVNITVTKITKGKVASLNKADQQLSINTDLGNNDTLNLVGTANATGGITGQLKVVGKITIGGTGKLSNPLRFNGDVDGSNLTLNNATDGKGVTVTGGTLTLQVTKLTVLKNTNFSLTTPDTTDKHPLTYKPELVTKSTITLGTIVTSGTNVKLSELPLIPACITGTGGSNGFSATANLSLTRIEAAGTLKDPAGLNMNLATIATTSLNSSTVKINKGEKDKVKSLPGASDNLQTSTTLVKGDTLTLNISGGSTTLTGTITVTKSGELTGTLELTGGITASISGLAGGDGTLQTTGVNIFNPKYDPDEFHVNHQDTHCCYWGAKVFKWTEYNPMTVWWHIPVILGPFQICLAYIFIYSLHYRDSSLSRSIVNQPKMSTALSIIFYMCHEILLALGFPGIASDDNILLPMQLIGAFLMVLLAFYSVGYITEYKRNDPLNWPTDGMTTWNALYYWLKMASKITNKNFKQLFTTDLRRLKFYYK
uniref:Tpr-related protein family member, putative n=1 Tax=Theileria annulata TaxID=5874 RepID=A0A3B0MG24_THEAN